MIESGIRFFHGRLPRRDWSAENLATEKLRQVHLATDLAIPATSLGSIGLANPQLNFVALARQSPYPDGRHLARDTSTNGSSPWLRPQPSMSEVIVLDPFYEAGCRSEEAGIDA